MRAAAACNGGQNGESLASFRLTLPATVQGGQSFDLTVEAVGSRGSTPFTAFDGTVDLTVSDGTISPDSLELAGGTGTVAATVSGTTGEVTITAARDGVDGSEQVSVGTQPADELAGDPDDAATEAIPQLDFEPSIEQYSDDHPELGGMLVSHDTLLLAFTLETTVAEANAVLADIGAEIVGGRPGVAGEASGILALRVSTETHQELSTLIASLEANANVDIVVQDVLLPEPVPDDDENGIETQMVPGPNGGIPSSWTWEATPSGGNWFLSAGQVMITSFGKLLTDHPEVRVVNISLGYNWAPNAGIDADTNTTAQRIADRHGALFGLAELIRVVTGGELPVVVADAPASPGGATRSGFSNVNGHISAPGSDIVSTVLFDGYDDKSGTSMAAPHVTGLVSYLYSLDPALPRPDLSDNALRDILQDSAVPVAGGASDRIDAFGAALELDAYRGLPDVVDQMLDIDDANYGSDDLPGLLDSGDIHVRATRCLDEVEGADSLRTTVRASGEAATLGSRTHTSGAPDRVYTVQSGTAFDVRAFALDASGQTIASALDTFTPALGGDVYWEPECSTEPIGAAPEVAITEPPEDSGPSDNEYAYDDLDEERGQWYTVVSLEGEATDEEDGSLTGESLTWTTDRTAYQDAQLGTGATLTDVRLYGDSDACSSETHVITLAATDSDGNVSTATRSITIWTLC